MIESLISRELYIFGSISLVITFRDLLWLLFQSIHYCTVWWLITAWTEYKIFAVHITSLFYSTSILLVDESLVRFVCYFVTNIWILFINLFSNAFTIQHWLKYLHIRLLCIVNSSFPSQKLKVCVRVGDGNFPTEKGSALNMRTFARHWNVNY